MSAIIAIKQPQFCFDAECDFDHFGRAFDYIMMQSIITHAPFDWVERCASRISAVLAEPNGVLSEPFSMARLTITGRNGPIRNASHIGWRHCRNSSLLWDSLGAPLISFRTRLV